MQGQPRSVVRRAKPGSGLPTVSRFTRQRWDTVVGIGFYERCVASLDSRPVHSRMAYCDRDNRSNRRCSCPRFEGLGCRCLYSPEARYGRYGSGAQCAINSVEGGWSDGGGEVWYFRLRITNRGNAVARDVHVFLERVEQLKDDSFIPAKRFSPMFLKWANLGTVTMSALWTDMPRFCDLFHITDPKCKQAVGEDLPGVAPFYGVLALDLEVLPNQQGHLLEPGVYRFTLRLGAANCRPRTKTLRVEWPGSWYVDERGMFAAIKINSV